MSKSSPNPRSFISLWGLAAYHSWRAYGDAGSLDYAQVAWRQLHVYMVQPADSASGSQVTRNVPIETTCNGGVCVSLACGTLLIPFDQPRQQVACFT